MKIKYLILGIVCFLFISCSGSYNYNIKPGFHSPLSKDIAILSLYSPYIGVSVSATSLLEECLREGKMNEFMTAKESSELLRENNISLPRIITGDFARKIKAVLNVKYLLTGRVDIWKKGGIANNTEVGALFILYDVNSGDIIWKVDGLEKGNGGIFAESRETLAKTVFTNMLSKWEGFYIKIEEYY